MKKYFKFYRFAFLLSFVIFSFPTFASVKFDDLDLNNEDSLLFTVQNNILGTPSYKTLFFTQLEETKIKESPKILTCFPEKMELLNEGKILQIRNRYGEAKYSIAEKKLEWTSFKSEIPTNYSQEKFMSVSPNGNFLCYVKQTGNAFGQLIILDCKTNKEKVLVEKTPLSYKSINAKWSPDSKVLIYEKDDSIYFIKTSDIFGKIDLPENYRKIGSGTINSIQWTAEKSLIYINDDIIYSIDENELYTRGLYSSLLGSGKILARIPNYFDSVQDKFWINDVGSKLVLLSKKNTVYFYSIEETKNLDYLKTENIFSLRDLSGSVYDVHFFWTINSVPILWVDSLTSEGSSKISYAYLLKDEMESLFEAKNSIVPIPSPDRKKIAFTDSDKFYVYDLTLQKNILSKDYENVNSAVWNGSSSLYVGDEETVKLVSLTGNEKVLFLSSASKPRWNGNKIICTLKDSKSSYFYDAEKGTWKTFFSSNKEARAPQEKNGFYRVFLGSSLNSYFANSIYVRSLSGKVKTYSVYKQTEDSLEAPKKAVLVFDAMKNSEGLAQILQTLNTFNLKCTFFFNGEFIRRYPDKAKQIVNSGHECASSFFSSADLTENNFIIDKEFIQRGLARNEDEFFTATGHELATLWHAPYYHSSSIMISAAEEAGYNYLQAFNEFNDTISFESCKDNKYLDASDLIDSYIENLYDGIIIPISVGKPDGTRNDFLYEKLDLLISAILDKGYQLVSYKELN